MDYGFYLLLYNQKFKYIWIVDVCMNTWENICSNSSDFSADRYLGNYNDGTF